MALLGIGIYCEVSNVKVPTNQTIAENTTTTTTVKPDLNVNTNTTIADEVQEICLEKSAEECVKIIFDTIHSG